MPPEAYPDDVFSPLETLKVPLDGLERGRVLDYPLGIDLTSSDGSITALFNRLSRVVPENQQLEAVNPETRVGAALQLMAHQRISQVPIVSNDHLLGMFSYRSFARHLEHMSSNITAGELSALPVIDFHEQVPVRTFDTDIAEALADLDAFDAVIVGTTDDVQAIITTVDALKFFYGLASPYVIMAEIEVAIRALIKASVDDTALADCIARVNGYASIRKKIGYSLGAMTFGEYLLLIFEPTKWRHFPMRFGANRAYALERFKWLRQMRNALFHFSSPMSDADYERLRNERSALRVRGELHEATRDELEPKYDARTHFSNRSY